MPTPGYRLPILSGVLLALAFYPLYLWPLVFVALVPLFYFAGASGRSRRELLAGGFITGLISMGPLVFCSLTQVRTLVGDEMFSYAVRISSVPVLLIMAAAFAIAAYGYARLRTSSLVYNALIGAALYTIIEIFYFSIFGGYFMDSFAEAIVLLPQALMLASLGGALFVSSLAAFGNVLLAEALQAPRRRLAPTLRSTALCAAAIIALYIGAYAYRLHEAPAQGGIASAIIQTPSLIPEDLLHGVDKDGEFSDPVFEAQLQAAEARAEFVMYPYSPFNAVTYPGDMRPPARGTEAYISEDEVGRWLTASMQASTTVLLWNTTVIAGARYDQFALWRNGTESMYQKQKLYPLSDYSPAWASLLGIHSPYAIEPGQSSLRPLVGNIKAGGLICSELHQPERAQQEALVAPFIVAIGSDAMFPDDLMGNYSLAVARYRAAENNIAIARGNINGPSAFIRGDGSLESYLGYFKEGIVRGTLPEARGGRTLYSYWGQAPEYVLVFGIIALAILRKYRRARTEK